MESKRAELCPCGSGHSYGECCSTYHQTYGAPTCETLMRSRYSAFVFGLVDYLLKTTHPSHRTQHQREEILFTCKTIQWTKLEVLHTWQGEQNDKVGKVLFRAHFIHEGKKDLHEENSRFKRYGKEWVYVDGDVKEESTCTH